MNKAMIETIIHLANVASADNYPGQKQELKDGAWKLFKQMMDEHRQPPPDMHDGLLRDLDREQDHYDAMNLSRGL